MLFIKSSLDPRKKSNNSPGVVTPRLKTIGPADLDCLSGCFDTEEQS